MTWMRTINSTKAKYFEDDQTMRAPLTVEIIEFWKEFALTDTILSEKLQLISVLCIHPDFYTFDGHDSTKRLPSSTVFYLEYPKGIK